MSIFWKYYFIPQILNSQTNDFILIILWVYTQKYEFILKVSNLFLSHWGLNPPL